MSASKPRKAAEGAPKKLHDREFTIPATRTIPPAKEALMSRSIRAVSTTIGITEQTRHDGRRAPRILTAVLGCLVLASCASPTPAPPASSPVPTTAATYSAQLCSAAADYQNAANAVVHLD